MYKRFVWYTALAMCLVAFAFLSWVNAQGRTLRYPASSSTSTTGTAIVVPRSQTTPSTSSTTTSTTSANSVNNATASTSTSSSVTVDQNKGFDPISVAQSSDNSNKSNQAMSANASSKPTTTDAGMTTVPSDLNINVAQLAKDVQTLKKELESTRKELEDAKKEIAQLKKPFSDPKTAPWPSKTSFDNLMVDVLKQINDLPKKYVGWKDFRNHYHMLNGITVTAHHPYNENLFVGVIGKPTQWSNVTLKDLMHNLRQTRGAVVPGKKSATTESGIETE